jgi:hypothetical protein
MVNVIVLLTGVPITVSSAMRSGKKPCLEPRQHLAREL